jgi:hypothetical protein
MKGDTIPDQDHVARLCFPKHIPEGQIQATAFMVREDEESLSVNWLEFLNCSCRENEITALRDIYNATFNRVGTRAMIAVLNVGEVREKVLKESSDGRNLEILHDPIADDPSHSGIYNLQYNDEEIAELILESVQANQTYPARNLGPS